MSANQYRVIIDVPEDDEWEAQQLLDYMVFDDEQKARAYANTMNLSKYPKGTSTFLEVRPRTQWRRL